MKPVQAHLTIRVHCIDFPGRSFDGKADIKVGPQKGNEVVGDAKEADFLFDLRVERNAKTGKPNFLGPLRIWQAGRAVSIPLLGRPAGAALSHVQAR